MPMKILPRAAVICALLSTIVAAEPADIPAAIDLNTMVQDARCKQVLVTCLINGKPMRMMLDTGATHTVLHNESADSLKHAQWLDTSRMEFKGNSSQRPRILLASVQAGQLAEPQHPILVLSLESVRSMMAERIDGILGMDILGRLPFTFAPASGSFHWGAPSGATLTPLYGTRDDAGRMLVQAQVKGRPVEVLLDTGSSLTRVYADEWKPGKAGKKQAKVSDVDSAGQKQVVLGKAADMELAPGVLIRNVSPAFCSRDDRSMLGMDVLKDVVLVHLPTVGTPYGAFFIAK